jgi:uncharacterized protein (DUF305 family)
MDSLVRRTIVAGILVAVGITGVACGTAAGHPANGVRPNTTQASPRPAAAASADTVQPGPRSAARAGYTAADVQFVQHMIGHHAQALTMTSLVQSRTGRDDMRLLAQRIEVSQTDEIAAMRRWLEARHETVPDGDMEHMHHDTASTQPLMPGMLTPPELDRLASAKGGEFDRLFLQYMIRHHEGALTMVAALFATSGAGQEAQLFDFASDVDADQRAEIARMRAMLAAMGATPATPDAPRRP